MLDYEELILERQDNKCWWDDLPDEVFDELTEDDLFYEDDLYNGVNLI